jgi:hypothetical protein
MSSSNAVLVFLPHSVMSFPDPVFETLLLKLANALEIAQKESTTNPQARQALYQAVCTVAAWLGEHLRMLIMSTDDRLQECFSPCQRDCWLFARRRIAYLRTELDNYNARKPARC